MAVGWAVWGGAQRMGHGEPRATRPADSKRGSTQATLLRCSSGQRVATGCLALGTLCCLQDQLQKLLSVRRRSAGLWALGRNFQTVLGTWHPRSHVL